MSILDGFTKDQRDLLVALPYRVGLWIGSVDSTGGDDANEAEMQALSQIVTGFAEDFLKSEFVQTMMEETISRKDEWESWANHMEEVPAECTRAVALLNERIDRKEVASFKLTVMEIATSVAMAYREFDDNKDVAYRLKTYSRVFIDKVRSLMLGKASRSLDEFLNISDVERKALDVLIKSLSLANSGQSATP